MGEAVLVIPRSQLFNRQFRPFQGFRPGSLEEIRSQLDSAGLFKERAEVEEDVEYKQLIIYTVLRCRSSLFVYRRIGETGEKRLLNKFSIGIGGHINNSCATNDLDNLFRINLLRELLEEVYIHGPFSYHLWGLINDDRTDVGRHHLGLVYLVSSLKPGIRVREENKLKGGLVDIGALARLQNQMESWSAILIPEITRLIS